MNVTPPGLLDHGRPRVEGDREQEILQATLTVLADVGYDRLTMDAVAARARASKATLYRRWNTKAALVVDAVHCQKGPAFDVDTGTLRGDLLASACDHGGLNDRQAIGVLASLMTAVYRDADFAEAWRRDFVQPQIDGLLAIFERARDRGEIPGHLDLDLIANALPGIVLHRIFVLGEPPDTESVTRVIDSVILPACRLAGPGRRADLGSGVPPTPPAISPEDDAHD